MGADVRDLDDRIGRLERENRRLKRWGATACVGFALFGLLGMAAPAICDVVSGERFVLRDASGRQRLLVDAYQVDSPTLTLHSSAGKTLAKLGLDERGEGYLELYDEKGASKAVFSTARPDKRAAALRRHRRTRRGPLRGRKRGRSSAAAERGPLLGLARRGLDAALTGFRVFGERRTTGGCP